jgi:hypothetical protein
MDSNEIKNNLSVSQNWVRILYMILFLIIHSVAKSIVVLIVVIQAILKLFTSELNGALLGFSKNLNFYIFQTLEFLTYQTEEKPFPFSDFPSYSKEEANEDNATHT